MGQWDGETYNTTPLRYLPMDLWKTWCLISVAINWLVVDWGRGWASWGSVAGGRRSWVCRRRGWRWWRVVARRCRRAVLADGGCTGGGVAWRWDVGRNIWLGLSAPPHGDRLLDKMWVVQLQMAHLLRDLLADRLGLQMWHQVGHESRRQVTQVLKHFFNFVLDYVLLYCKW